MYVPPVFKVDDETAMRFVAARGFGLFVAVDGRTPIAVHVPFLCETASNDAAAGITLEAHVARANPLHQVIAVAPAVMIAVSGPDAYISPDWYVSKDQVPTWNYIAVHLHGTATILTPDATLAHVDRLSEQFEHRLLPKPPWRSEKMTVAKRTAMLAAIVVMRIRIYKIEAQWKLGQHKSRADRIEVARSLAWRGAWDGCALAEIMQAKLG